jgi:sec-independent protein translocase protein TatA
MIGLDNPLHLLIVLIVLLLLFGAKRLPELGRSLGSGLRGFKDTVSGESTQAAAAPQLPPAPVPAAPAPTPTVVLTGAEPQSAGGGGSVAVDAVGQGPAAGGDPPTTPGPA